MEIGPPGPPTLISFKDHKLQLSWTPPQTDGGYPITGYVIQMKNLLFKKWVKIATIQGETQFADIDFYLQGIYRFRVYACSNYFKGKPSKVSGPLILSSENEPPKIDRQYLRPIVIFAGDTFTLWVKIHGGSTKEGLNGFFWSLNDKPIQSSEYVNITNTSYCTRLVCYNAELYQSGTYEIEAFNEFGSDVASVLVTIIDTMPVGFSRRSNSLPFEDNFFKFTGARKTVPPGQPSAPIVRKSHLLHLTWSAPEDNTVVTGYVVECKDLFGTQWSRIAVINGNVCAAEIYFYLRNWYEFRICAFNDDGKGTPSAASEPFNVEKDCTAYPNIEIDNLQAVVINTGESFCLWSKLSGEPPPTVHWSLNEMSLEKCDNISITDTLYDTGLVCENAIPSNSGRYTIVAANESGSNTATVEVTVFDAAECDVSDSENSEEDSSLMEASNHKSTSTENLDRELFCDKSIELQHKESQTSEIDLSVPADVDENIFHFRLETLNLDDDKISSRFIVEKRKKGSLQWDKIGEVQGHPFLSEEEEFEFRLIASDDIVPDETQALSDATESDFRENNENDQSKSFCDILPDETKAASGTCENDARESFCTPPETVEYSSGKENDPNEIISSDEGNLFEMELDSRNIQDSPTTPPVLTHGTEVASPGTPPVLTNETEVTSSVSLESREMNVELKDNDKESENDFDEIEDEPSGPTPTPTGPLLAFDVHRDCCKLKWNEPLLDTGLTLEGYLVEYENSHSGLWIPEAITSDTEIEITDLTPGHFYNFRVRAITKDEESKPLELASPIIAKDPDDSLDEYSEENGIEDVTAAMKRVLCDKFCTDVEFSVQSSDGWSTFSAHRLILSLWSTVFANKFFKNGVENQVIVTVTDVAPAVFEVVLKFMYGISSELYSHMKDVNFILKVYNAASIYQIEALKNTCCKICSTLMPNKNNVFYLLEAGTLLNSEVIQDRCLKILQTQTPEALAALNLNSVTLSMVVFLLNMPQVSFPSEYELIKWILSWAKNESVQIANQKDFENIMRVILPLLDFMELSADEFGRLFEMYDDWMSKEDGFSIIMNILIPGSFQLPPWHSISREVRTYKLKR